MSAEDNIKLSIVCYRTLIVVYFFNIQKIGQQPTFWFNDLWILFLKKKKKCLKILHHDIKIF